MLVRSIETRWQPCGILHPRLRIPCRFWLGHGGGHEVWQRIPGTETVRLQWYSAEVINAEH